MQNYKSIYFILFRNLNANLGIFSYGYIISEISILYSQLALSFGIKKYDTEDTYNIEDSSHFTEQYRDMLVKNLKNTLLILLKKKGNYSLHHTIWRAFRLPFLKIHYK